MEITKDGLVLLFLVLGFGCSIDDTHSVAHAARSDSFVRVNGRESLAKGGPLTVTSSDDLHITAEGEVVVGDPPPVQSQLGELHSAMGSGGDPDDEYYCNTSLQMELPDHTTKAFDGCVNHDLHGTFEFDPDKAPEVRSIRLFFDSMEESDFQCSLLVDVNGLCGAGTYYVGRATTAHWVSYDCAGVKDAYEGEWYAQGGTVQIDAIEVIAEPGHQTSWSIPVRVKGSMNLLDMHSWSIQGSFQVNAMLSSEDAEEVECLAGMENPPNPMGYDDDDDDDDEVGVGCSVSPHAHSNSGLVFSMSLGLLLFGLRRKGD